MPENDARGDRGQGGAAASPDSSRRRELELETACDLYVAAFLLPKRKGGQFAGPDGLPRRGAETVPTSGTVWEWLRGVKPFGPLFGAAVDAADAARAFHWPLEFPDVDCEGRV